jgi:WD40 repeat protein
LPALSLEHPATVLNAAFSEDGTRIVTACDDGFARIWDATSGKLLVPPLPHGTAIRVAAFSPDGTRVVTAGGITARIWDASTGQPRPPPFEHEALLPVTSALFSPDVSASSSPAVRARSSGTRAPARR